MNKFYTKASIDMIKRDICLPVFLEEMGYQKVRAKSSRRQLCYRAGEKTLIVSKNRQDFWVYFEANKPPRHFEPGEKNVEATSSLTIIDFIMRDQHKTFTQACGTALEFNKTGLYRSSAEFCDVTPQKDYAPSDLAEILNRTVPGHQSDVCKSYFEHRGLNPEFLNQPVARYFYEWSVSFDGQPRKKTTCTAMRTQDGVLSCLLSSDKNRQTFARGKRTESLWYTSNVEMQTANKYSKAFIAESWQDALAHYQLNEKSLEGQTVLYMSCQGNLTDGQTAFVKRLLNEGKVESITTIFDNDIKGYTYTAKMLNDCCAKEIQIELVPDKREGIIECYFKNTGIEQKGFLEFLAAFPSPALSKDGITAECVIPVDSFRDTIKTLSEQLKASRFNVEYPTTKDFNDDLIKTARNLML